MIGIIMISYIIPIIEKIDHTVRRCPLIDEARELPGAMERPPSRALSRPGTPSGRARSSASRSHTGSRSSAACSAVRSGDAACSRSGDASPTSPGSNETLLPVMTNDDPCGMNRWAHNPYLLNRHPLPGKEFVIPVIPMWAVHICWRVLLG